MNVNVNQDDNHKVDGLDLSLYVGSAPAQQKSGTSSLIDLKDAVKPKHWYYQQRFIAPVRPRRRNPTQTFRAGKSETVPAPFLWATTKRATIYSLEQLRTKQIFTISGQVLCKKCEQQFEMEYNLQEKFQEIGGYIRANKAEMRDRAPSGWMNPVFPSCKFCGQENCVKPVISTSKKSINWLFLFLGQMLGCLTLAQLKYFCKHTGIHRTGAKDRLLFSTYICLCKQLSPGMF